MALNSRPPVAINESNIALTTSDIVDLAEEQDPLVYANRLQKIYEDGEIQRFLHVFSSYVSEVKAWDAASNSPSSARINRPDREVNFEDSLAKFIADNLVEPNLPPSKQVIPGFTLGRARLTTQRLYLAFQTSYLPFFQSCYDLATWKSYGRSLAYCSLYWVLWWHNMILPALIVWPVIIAFQRRLQPHPVGQQLKDYQTQVALADDFGERVSKTIAASSSTLGLKDFRRLAKLANCTRKPRSPSSREKIPLTETFSTDSLNCGSESPTTEIPPAMERKQEQELQDLKAIGLYWMTCFADLHERIHNILAWRNLAVSCRYLSFLLGTFCFTAFVPTKYMAKLFWFMIGVLYWHVIPVLNALSPEACSRLPPMFADVPTDADYAMQLISQRVAAGQEILPLLPPSKLHVRCRSEEATAGKPFVPKSLSEIGKLMTEEATRITKAATEIREGRPITKHVHPFVSNALALAIPEANPEVYTYMCQFGTTPGLMTLTLKHLYVTPMFSGTLKEEIPVEDISGVKKIGLLKGIRISWTKTEASKTEEKEFKFSWVSNRDDLFARLVGLGKQRWKSV